MAEASRSMDARCNARDVRSGWHLATHQGIAEHARTGAVLWIAEGRGEFVAAGDKVAFSSARLVSQVGTLTQIIAVQWAAECAKRVLRHFEDHHPEDKRPREAIQAAPKWAKDPTEANRDAAARRPPPPTPYAAYAAYAAAAGNTYLEPQSRLPYADTALYDHTHSVQLQGARPQRDRFIPL